MLTFILTILAIISAAIHIRAEYRGPMRHIHIFKPLTIVLILLIAILGQGTLPIYRVLIIVGLLCSMAGDVLLMPPWDRFVAGLVAFLIAHLFYSAAFITDLISLAWWPLIPLVIYGIAIYILLAPSLGSLKWPVIAYIAVILVMAWLAWARWWGQSGQMSPRLAFIGSVLFIISDSILALNRFGRPFKLARALNLATYFAAQWFIAGSVGGLAF